MAFRLAKGEKVGVADKPLTEVERKVLGVWRLVNLYGEPTQKVQTVTNVRGRACGRRYVGWVTVNGKVEPLPQFIEAIDSGYLRREA